MGGSKPKTPKPSPEIQQQLQQQQLLSQQLATQQSNFEKQYQQQLAAIQQSYDQQAGVLKQQYGDSQQQYGLLTSQLQQQLTEQQKAAQQQAEEYSKLLEQEKLRTDLTNQNASRDRYAAQQTASDTTANANRLLGNTTNSQQAYKTSSMLRGSQGSYNSSSIGSLLRR